MHTALTLTRTWLNRALGKIRARIHEKDILQHFGFRRRTANQKPSLRVVSQWDSWNGFIVREREGDTLWEVPRNILNSRISVEGNEWEIHIASLSLCVSVYLTERWKCSRCSPQTSVKCQPVSWGHVKVDCSTRSIFDTNVLQCIQPWI